VKKILHVAVREFIATAMTKAFIIGAFVVPSIMVALMVFVFPILLNRDSPEIEGELAVIDRTGQVVEEIADRLQPEAIAARNREETARIAEKVEETVGPLGDAVTDRVAEELSVPRINVSSLPEGTEVDSEKGPLREGTTADRGARLALVVIDANAVTPDGEGEYGGFEFYLRGGLDDRVEREIGNSIREAIRHVRMLAAGLDPDEVRALTTVKSPRAKEVTETGERTSLGEVRIFVSFGFMAVLMISVMIGGQYLLTTTVEEKSSRVVEVLLSALSPMQLMTGKILGQLCVGLTILLIYSSVGGGALILYGLADLIGLVPLIYMIVFFLIAYVTVGALMAAVGSAVNDMREAQSLQGPVMITLIIPYMLWFPISRDPNSLFATIISFLPPVNPFVMMLRITSTEPPPTWQVLLSILVGLLGVYVAVWAAAKVFRIGLLMFGKPPNLVTLVRWVRMA
jgi:ABC-2 type transport system permease protein